MDLVCPTRPESEATSEASSTLEVPMCAYRHKGKQVWDFLGLEIAMMGGNDCLGTGGNAARGRKLFKQWYIRCQTRWLLKRRLSNVAHHPLLTKETKTRLIDDLNMAHTVSLPKNDVPVRTNADMVFGPRSKWNPLSSLKKRNGPHHITARSGRVQHLKDNSQWVDQLA